jgi:hypothetical protein
MHLRHKGKVEVNFTLEQATKTQIMLKYNSTVSLTSALDGAGVVNTLPLPLHSWERPSTHCTGRRVGFKAGLDGCGKSHSMGIRSQAIQHVAVT